MRALKQAEIVANFRRRRDPQATHGGRSKIGNDVTKHVLGDDDIVEIRALDHVDRDGIHIGIIDRNVGIITVDIIADGPEERVGAQDIRLVAHGDAPLAVERRAVALSCEVESEARDTLGSAARHDQSVRRNFTA